MEFLFYRIYDPGTLKFIYHEGTPMQLAEFFQNTAHINCTHRIPYHRFTGKLDTSGRKIFENDIVTEKNGNRSIVKWSKRALAFTLIRLDEDNKIIEISRLNNYRLASKSLTVRTCKAPAELPSLYTPVDEYVS
jgi:hypothetical protein